MMSELVRVYSNEEHLDEVPELIERFASPMTPHVNSYNGNRLVMHRELDLEEELLVHLYALGHEVAADKLTDWILGAKSHSVKSKLGNMKQARKIHYDDGVAKITPPGVEEAEEIVDEYFGGDIPDVERRDEQLTDCFFHQSSSASASSCVPAYCR